MRERETWLWTAKGKKAYVENQFCAVFKVKSTEWAALTLNVASPCNYEETDVSGFAINALVEKHVMVTRETIDSNFVGRFNKRQQTILATSGDTIWTLLHRGRELKFK